MITGHHLLPPRHRLTLTRDIDRQTLIGANYAKRPPISLWYRWCTGWYSVGFSDFTVTPYLVTSQGFDSHTWSML